MPADAPPPDTPQELPACLILPAADRALLMDWLAGLLARPPTARTVAVLAGPDGETALAGLAAVPGLASAARAVFGSVRAARAKHDAKADTAAARDLASAFATLFGDATGHTIRDRPGAGGCGAVSRLASAYQNDGCSDATAHRRARIAAFLAGHDLERTDAAPEPADHIAVMLAALSALAAREAQARAQTDPELVPRARAMGDALATAQQHFATRELAPWLPAFGARVTAADPCGFHAAVACLAGQAVVPAGA